MRSQEGDLGFGLHPFCDHGQVQHVREGDDGDHDRRVAGIGGDVANEGRVDLEFVDREAFQVSQ